jgi:hypothetical protein
MHTTRTFNSSGSSNYTAVERDELTSFEPIETELKKNTQSTFNNSDSSKYTGRESDVFTGYEPTSRRPKKNTQGTFNYSSSSHNTVFEDDVSTPYEPIGRRPMVNTHDTFNNSSSSNCTEPESDVFTGYGSTTAEPKKDINMITIAISGASSSGKTTLAMFLAEILKGVSFSIRDKASFTNTVNGVPYGPKINNNMSGNPPGASNAGASSETELARAIVVREDDYFKNKSTCPSSTFISSSNDSLFIQRSIQHGELLNYTANQVKAQDNDAAVTESGVFRNISRSHLHVMNAYRPQIFSVTGPNLDCYDAIDVHAITKDIIDIKKTRVMSQHAQQRHDIASLRSISSEEDLANMLAKHAGLVASMREQVDWVLRRVQNNNNEDKDDTHNFVGRYDLNDPEMNTRATLARMASEVCIVEGFLLFPTPPSPDIKDFAPISNSIKQAHTMNNHFDVKLFLPTSKEVARERRFRRGCYVDAPHGDRAVGQMWKTEGYFEEVVWKNYVRENAWLFDGGETNIEGKTPKLPTGGGFEMSGRWAFPSESAKLLRVCMRPRVDDSFESTVEWAVKTILSEVITAFELEMAKKVVVPVKMNVEMSVEDDGRCSRQCSEALPGKKSKAGEEKPAKAKFMGKLRTFKSKLSDLQRKENGSSNESGRESGQDQKPNLDPNRAGSQQGGFWSEEPY